MEVGYEMHSDGGVLFGRLNRTDRLEKYMISLSSPFLQQAREIDGGLRQWVRSAH